ncbi:GD22655 [Drosophila simulans]|uniref:GD22655 n=1 Tax=Drosophila simulans TaxID=7240 RepID=B4NV28_DROSI|nr:GD22655 [Drosophila simulans]
MSTKPTFEHPAHVEQRDLPSLKAREQPPKKKRGGRRIKLLSARRLNIELLKTATNEEDRQRYKERLAAINKQLRGAK